jgi:hypothetical protein
MMSALQFTPGVAIAVFPQPALDSAYRTASSIGPFGWRGRPMGDPGSPFGWSLRDPSQLYRPVQAALSTQTALSTWKDRRWIAIFSKKVNSSAHCSEHKNTSFSMTIFSFRPGMHHTGNSPYNSAMPNSDSPESRRQGNEA